MVVCLFNAEADSEHSRLVLNLLEKLDLPLSSSPASSLAIVFFLGSDASRLTGFKQELSRLRKSRPDLFICAFSELIQSLPTERLDIFDMQHVNMITDDLDALERVLPHFARCVQFKSDCVGKKRCTCPQCGFTPLNEDLLWEHLPLFHANLENIPTDVIA